MTAHLKLLIALPLIALMAGCVAGGGGGVNSNADLEQTLSDDLDGDGTITDGGIEVGAEE